MKRTSHTDADQDVLLGNVSSGNEDGENCENDDTQVDHLPNASSANSSLESFEYEYHFDRQRPSILRYLPRLVRYDDQSIPIEASGCAVDMYARSTIFMAGIFLGPALLELASMQATSECLQRALGDNGVDCDNTDDLRVFGFKPSSLLTNMSTIANFVSTIFLPIAGVIVDYTPYRKHVGMYTAAGLTFIKFMELSLGARNWFLVAWLQIITGILYQIHTASVYANSFELSKDPKEQSAFQSHFFMVMYVAMLLYMLQVLIPGQILQLDDVSTGRLAVLITSLTCLPLFFIAWRYLFRDKPPCLKNTSCSVKIFLAGIAWSEAADTALATIVTTYMSEYLRMNSLEIGMTLLVVLIAGMPGTYVGNYLCKRFDSVVSAKTCLVQYILVTLAASFFLRPSTKNLAYLFGFLWGMCQGWMHPQHTTIFVTISPKGKGEVELMGLFLFAASIFGFIPPLVFSIFNEMGLPVWAGMCTLVMYFVLGYIGLVAMGDYEAARVLAHGPVPDAEEIAMT